MSDNRVLEVGNASIENIKRCVTVLKTAVKAEKQHKPSVTVYIKDGELTVGLYGNTKSSKSYELPPETIILHFTETNYGVISKQTGDVLKISKVIHTNAMSKYSKMRESNDTSLPKTSQSSNYEELLYHVSDFLEGNNRVNLIYSQGVGGYNAYDYLDKEGMVDEIRQELTKGKSIKGIQIMGLDKVMLYIKVRGTEDIEVSFTYLGLKDNIYETFKWDGKSSLTQVITNKVNDAKEYDSSLGESKLDKGTPPTSRKNKTKSVLSMSEDDLDGNEAGY